MRGLGVNDGKCFGVENIVKFFFTFAAPRATTSLTIVILSPFVF